MVPTGQVEAVLGPHLQRIYRPHLIPSCDPGRMPDAVNLSVTARRMRIAKEAVQALEDIRVEKVANIRQMVSLGNYGPPESEIAQRMLRGAIGEEV